MAATKAAVPAAGVTTTVLRPEGYCEKKEERRD
jgi:hypothetical protein